MQRTVFTVLTFGLLYVGAAALIGQPKAMAAQGRPAYDPFAMKRASEAPRGDKEREDFERRREIEKRLKDHVRPPHRPGTKSPHKPNDGNNGHGNDDDHDDDDNPGQGNGGHGTGDHDDNGNHGEGNNGNHNGHDKPNGRK